MKTYNFVTAVRFEAESQEDAEKMLDDYLADTYSLCEDLCSADVWALDPADEDE